MSLYGSNNLNLKRYSIDKSDLTSILLLILLFLFLIIITWQKWGNPVIDCGRDLYVAERIISGEALYTDVYYVYGPLVPYIFSILFLIFGISLNIAYFTGIFIALLSTIVLYYLSRTILSPFISGLTVSICLLFFIFKTNIANYIFPYTYAATFGTVFCLIILLLLSLHLREQKVFYLYISGVLAGLSIITKLEFIYIATGVVVLYFLLTGIVNIKISIKDKIITLIPIIGIPLSSLEEIY